MDDSYKADWTMGEHSSAGGIVRESATWCTQSLTVPEQDHVVVAGSGACTSCGCQGFVRKKGEFVEVCECGHHYKQHK